MSTAKLRQTTLPVTSKYGLRILKSTGAENFHKGTDFPFTDTTPVSSFGAGRVTFAGRRPYYYPGTRTRHPDWERGIHVIVEHAPGIATSYHSLDRLTVSTGDWVELGETVGYGGQSALAATGDHCHVGLWLNGQHVDLEKYLTPGEIVEISNSGTVLTDGATHFDNTEDDMYTDADRDRDNNVYNAIFKGGPSMADNGRSLSQSIGDIVKALDLVRSTVTAPVSRMVDGREVKVSQIQELADAKTIAIRLEAKLAATSAAIAALALANGMDPKELADLIAAKVDDALADNFASIPDAVRAKIIKE